MFNIWNFLLQTLSVSLVSGLILILKAIFEDKLSPRWQYGVWLVLAVRVFVPATAEKFTLFPVGIYIEMLKNIVETKISSAYTSAYSADKAQFLFTAAPKSITDWLFIIYVSGILVFALRYIISYIKLRGVLKKFSATNTENQSYVDDFLRQHNLSRIKTVFSNGFNSAFICGIFKPVLVLPSDRRTDEKVLLHEITHLKHYDLLQSIFWCVLRCLHWCNPFMHFVFNKIENDMEILCDRRVLEKLHGEDRRDYGILLLNEVNNKYARVPGTTSISNGGKNIRKRIEAIARFKKYPKGMGLVSVCIVISLIFSCVFTSAVYSPSDSDYSSSSSLAFEKGVAVSEINRCTTMAGALDTYCKSIYKEQIIPYLSASPMENHAEIIESYRETYTLPKALTRYIGDDGQPYSYYTDRSGRPFSFFNINKVDENRYSLTIAFGIQETNSEEEKAAGYTEYQALSDSLLIPAVVRKEGNFWVVEETGERRKSDYPLNESLWEQAYNLGKDLEPLFRKVQKGENGTLETSTTTVFSIDYSSAKNQSNTFSMLTDSSYNDSILVSAEFGGMISDTTFLYTYAGEEKAIFNVALLYSSDPEAVFEKNTKAPLTSSSSSSSDGNGSRYIVLDPGKEAWDRTMINSSLDSNYEAAELTDGYEHYYKIAVYLNGELADIFEVEVNANG